MGSTESTLTQIENNGSLNEQRNNISSINRLDIEAPADDHWWWEIENVDLVLDLGFQFVEDKNIYKPEPFVSEPKHMLSDLQNVTSTFENTNLTKNNVDNKPMTSDFMNLSEKDLCSIKENKATNTKSEVREQTLEEFKEELRSKRLARQTAVQDLRKEVSTLRKQLASEQAFIRLLQNTGATNSEQYINNTFLDIPIRDNGTNVDHDTIIDNLDDKNSISREHRADIELASVQLSLQLANAENLSLRTELGVVQKQVVTLKEVISCCKQMLAVKEEHCIQLKNKLTEIENSFSEREIKIMSNNLREEYERQLGNIRQLRQLYEERQRVSAAEHENLQRLISIKKDELFAEQEKVKNVEGRNQTLLQEVESANNELVVLREECNEHKFEKRILKEEMEAVNTLVCKIIMGFNRNNSLDVDRLSAMLEENRVLLNDMATKELNFTDGASLPKLLFELVEQASKDSKPQNCTLLPIDNDMQENYLRDTRINPASTEEIIINLPKVWKVLIELLSHHHIKPVNFEENGLSEDCYNSVETPNGPKAELSVSKTYIKLKNLILEKKSLVKETNRLKILNCHLEYRLNEQEKRLSAVSLELTKTWHLVGKMQRQHRQLHTQEQILRYQLQQKRRLLTELKDELEYCRRKWAAARAKNDESQEQCNDLRQEFAKRKLEDGNNSAESGYSDSSPVSDEDERSVVQTNAAVSPNCSYNKDAKKHLFEHTGHVKRMKSTSPGRTNIRTSNKNVVIILRWNSAPPACGWNSNKTGAYESNETYSKNLVSVEKIEVNASNSQGAIPKIINHISRSTQRGAREYLNNQKDDCSQNSGNEGCESRIHQLEEQCKSLIQQVLETSNSRERLEIQLCRIEDEIAPAQYAIPLRQYINKNSMDRFTRASSVPLTGALTPREEEYTRKRSERLGRLEEESRQLLSHIKRTSDRGHYLRCSLDRISRIPSREASLESNTEDDSIATSSRTAKKMESHNGSKTMKVHDLKILGIVSDNKNLSLEEQEYTNRRCARLQRLEEESKKLLLKLSSNSKRACNLDTKLDSLHKRYNGDSILKKESQSIELEPVNRDCLKKGDNEIPQCEQNQLLLQELPQTSMNNEDIKNNKLNASNDLTKEPTEITDLVNAVQQRALPETRQNTLHIERITSNSSSTTRSTNIDADPTESLEDLVNRLRNLPFPQNDKN